MEAKFKIGDKVTAIALHDAFPIKEVPAREGLTVREIKLVQGLSIKPYYRLVAYEDNGLGYVEGAEHFFELG